jgi:glycosyltransferase involved in cell wall biosynthesis
MLFTDPRFFIWTWEMEDEIHQVCPIVYWHLWDNDPWPEFNRVLYESTDLINCINWKTYAMVKEHFPEKTNYIPHSLPPQIYHQLSDEQAKQSRQNLFGKDAEDKFIGIWVNRNARRKMPGDVLAAWALFVKELKEKHGKNDCMLVMHTDPFDHEGANLHEVVKVLGIQKNVVFSTDRVPFEQMNMLYNAVDFCVNISANEGFGLSTLEAMLTGKPIIALKTGGLTQQVVNDDNSENGIALEPEVRNLVGSQLVPYIYEDHVSNETVASAFMKLYEAGPEGRKALGQRAKEYSTKKYNHKKTINDWDCSLMNTIDNWKKSYKPWKMITL